MKNEKFKIILAMVRRRKKETADGKFHWAIYDQFHWGDEDHLEHFFYDRKTALEHYRFYKAAYPNESLGLVKYETFVKIKINYNSKKCIICGG